MAYVGDFVEFIKEIILFTGDKGQLSVQCWDNKTSIEIDSFGISPIEFMASGGKILFPIVYNFHAYMVNVESASLLEEFTHQSSLTLSEVTQCPLGNGVVFRVNALRPRPGDNLLEIVLTDTLRGDIFADFVAAPTVGTLPMEVYFFNRSDALQGIDHYLWSFGDGARSDQENPVHIYESLGKFSVTLTVYGPDGEASIRKFEFVLAERKFMKKCLHYGIAEEQGQGWSERGGDHWIWPESQAAIFTIINNNYRQEVIIDENDGLPYWIDTRDGPVNSGLVKCWRDKIDPLVENSGFVTAWEILFGEYTGELEQYFIEMLETYLVFRTVNTENIGVNGYDAYGLPTTLQVNYDLLKDGLLVPYAGATQIPVKRDVVIDRKAKGNAIQIKLTGQNSEFKMRKIESSLKVSDFAHNNTSSTEIGYQEILSNPAVWFSRETTLTDRITGMPIAGVITLITGPDGRDDSAFRIVTSLQFLNSSYPAGTLMLWHKTGFTISGVSLTEIGQTGDWILSYASSVPANIVITTGDVFDIRIFSTAVTIAAMQHYFENISEFNGDMYLP